VGVRFGGRGFGARLKRDLGHVVRRVRGQKRGWTVGINAAQVKSVATSDAGALAATHQLKSDAIDMKQTLLRGNIRLPRARPLVARQTMDLQPHFEFRRRRGI
jgi:hypothetical protein